MAFGTVAASLLFVFALFAGLAIVSTSSNQASSALASSTNEKQQEFLELINSDYEIGFSAYIASFGGTFIIEIRNTGSTIHNLEEFDMYIDNVLWDRSSVYAGSFSVDSGANPALLDPQEAQAFVALGVDAAGSGEHYVKVVSPQGKALATIIEVP